MPQRQGRRRRLRAQAAIHVRASESVKWSMSAVSAHVRPLLGLRQGQENMRCVHADQHASSPGLVRYSLRQLSPHLQLKQTKAWEPFLENALCW